MGIFSVLFAFALFYKLLYAKNDCSSEILVSNQSEIDQFMKTQYNNPVCIHFLLNGGGIFKVNMMKMMFMATNGSLIMRSSGGIAEINCSTGMSDLEELSKTIKPLSRASLVLLDGLTFTGCPVPILIEEASNVVIENCVFQNHKHGVLAIYNSQNVMVKNCTFLNNTSDGYPRQMKKYQGSSGGLSVGYNMNNSDVVLNITIINTKFINNSASPLAKYRVTSTEMVYFRNFTGRGGGLLVLVNAHYCQLNCVIKNCDFVNNSANSFGGALYILVAHVSNKQMYKIDSSTFSNNMADMAGALQLIDLREKVKDFIILITVVNCTFSNNEVTDSAGAVGIYSLLGKTYYSIRFEDCVFYENNAFAHGGAVHLGSYNFHNDRHALCPVQFINCTFCHNHASNGAAISVFYSQLRLYNVTIANNTESAVEMTASVVGFYGFTKFHFNAVHDVGGALYLLSSSQMILHSNTHLEFVNNTGRLGAALVVETGIVVSVETYNKLRCFLQHQVKGNVSSHHQQASLRFEGNNAIIGSDVLANNLNLCYPSKYSYDHLPSVTPRYRGCYNDTAQVNNSNASLLLQTSAVNFMIENENIDAYPGELIRLVITPYNELNCVTAATFQILESYISTSNTDDVGINVSLVFIPTIKELLPSGMNYPLKYRINFTNSPINLISKKFTIKVSSIRTAFSKSQVKCFQLTIAACPPGHVLRSTDGSREHECRCNLENDQKIMSCVQNESRVILKGAYWAHVVEIESIDRPLEYYYCPPGYCLCTILDGFSDVFCNNIYHHYNDDRQCVCDRQGFLCGKCRHRNKGFSALLNKCVSCGYANMLLVMALIIVDIIIITVILLSPFTLPSWLYPFLYFIQTTPYVAQYFGASFNPVQPYLHYIGSAVSLYFPYDFCLYPGMTAVATYNLKYIPLLLTLIISVACYSAHRGCLYKTKYTRFSWSGLWLLIILLYTDVVYTSMSILNCPMLTGYDGKRSLRWYVDGTVECFRGSHLILAVFAILVLALCVILIIIVIVINTGRLKKPSMEKVLQFSFAGDYKWWAPNELIRRFVFVIFIIMDPGNLKPVLLLTMVYVALYSYVQPYRQLYVNVLETIILTDIILLITTAPIADYKDNILFTDDKTFNVDQCGQVTAMSKHAILVIPFYYIPLILLVVLSIQKLGSKLKLHFKKCYGVKYQPQNYSTGDDPTELTAMSSYYMEFDKEHLVLIKQ